MTRALFADPVFRMSRVLAEPSRRHQLRALPAARQRPRRQVSGRGAAPWRVLTAGPRRHTRGPQLRFVYRAPGLRFNRQLTR